MNEFMLYTLTYLFSQALGIYSIYKLVRAFFEECIVKRCVEVGAFVGYYVLTSSLYLIVNVPIANFVVNIISVFLLTFMYSSSIKKKLLVDVLTYIFMAGVEMLVVTLTGYISFSITQTNDYHSIFGIVVINILKYVVSMAVSGFKNIKNGNTLPVSYWVLLLVIPVSSLFMLVVIFQSDGLVIYQITLSVIAVLIINSTVFFLFDRLAKSRWYNGLIEVDFAGLSFESTKVEVESLFGKPDNSDDDSADYKFYSNDQSNSVEVRFYQDKVKQIVVYMNGGNNYEQQQ